jgi:hypothetical protein
MTIADHNGELDICPPGVLWLMKHADERISHITLHHPQSGPQTTE